MKMPSELLEPISIKTNLAPLPIPNREVKPVSVDGTASWESRSPPKYTKDPSSEMVRGLLWIFTLLCDFFKFWCYHDAIDIQDVG